MLLTDEERKKFVVYLRCDAASNKSIADQLANSSTIMGPAIQELAKRKRVLALAEVIVAQELESAESQVI